MATIGVFDSGIGGLTVAKAIADLNAYDKLIYYGDIAHLPYGDKSAAAIQAYSVRIAEFLVAKGCETLVIACNSASASATDLLKEYLGHKIKVINVIDPMVDYVVKGFPKKHVGVIGTKRTIDSEIYQNLLKSKNKGISTSAMATPLLVPVIEENIFSEDLRKRIIEEYLHHADFQELDALILGCTHYPLLKKDISEYMGPRVSILDSSEIMGNYLNEFDPQNKSVTTEIECYASDLTPFFEESASRFFGKPIKMEIHHLMNIF